MAVYHQMGHQSDNLVGEENLKGYKGAILSPVNYTRQNVEAFMNRFRGNDNFEIIFDPQLYYPRTLKEKLRSWNYFPDSYETTDFSVPSGWVNLIRNLTQTVSSLRPNAICSPAVVPRSFTDDYYFLNSQITDILIDSITPLGLSVLQTVLVDLSSLAEYERVLSIASVITNTRASRFYVVFISDEVSPRRELEDTEELKGAMLLINELKNNGFEVLVGFTSSDILLWKTAGATSCATGKFWNTRRFNPGRWGDDTDAGNGHIAYLFEESLAAFLRESDILRTDAIRSATTQSNPYYPDIQSCISTGTPWVALGWRQYLYWFYDIESRLERDEASAKSLLRSADRNWETLEDEGVFMEERRNDGRWVRPWLRAIIEFQQPW